jgi:hypothetical protein
VSGYRPTQKIVEEQIARVRKIALAVLVIESGWRVTDAPVFAARAYCILAAYSMEYARKMITSAPRKFARPTYLVRPFALGPIYRQSKYDIGMARVIKEIQLNPRMQQRIDAMIVQSLCCILELVRCES